MGWRGTLRSINAAANRAERAARRRERALQKTERIADRHLSKMEKSLEAIRKKVEAFETRLTDAPVSKGGVTFSKDGRWSGTPFQAEVGSVSTGFEVRFGADAVSFDPVQVAFDGFSILMKSCCICSYGTFLAVEIEAETSKSNFKVITKATPEKSRIAIIGASGNLYWAFDGSVNGKLLKGTKKQGVVALEPFDELEESFRIAFIPNPTKASPDPDPITIEVTGLAINDTIRDVLSDRPSISDQFLKEAEKQMKTAHAQVQGQLTTTQNAIVAQGQGCAVLLALVSGGMGVLFLISTQFLAI